MSVFFIGWDLWQEMTFVLACCIILVFVLGLSKLWWNNRSMRRLEIIDQEKRARVSALSHCGVNAWRPPEIPFGVRAIQNGVEVEGIWISRPNTPDMSQIASSTLLGSTTLIGDQTYLSKGKERMVDPISPQTPPTRACLEDCNCRFPRPLAQSESATTVTSLDSTFCSRSNAPNPLDSKLLHPKPYFDSYIPRGLRDDRHKSDISSASTLLNPFTAPSLTPTIYSLKRASAVFTDADSTVSESALYRAANVVVRQNTRRANRGCVIVPAGSGRFVLDRSTEDTDTGCSGSQQRLTEPGKLNKAMPIRAQLRRTPTFKGRGRLTVSSSSDQI